MNSHRIISSTVVLLLVLLMTLVFLTDASSTTATERRVPVKRLQGPPEHFSHHRLPDPIQAALSSYAATFGISFEEDRTRGVWTFESVLPIDSSELFRLTLVAREMEFLSQLTLTLVDPYGASTPIPTPTEGFFGWSHNRAGDALTWQIDQPERGTWTLRIESTLPDPHIGAGRPSVAAVLENRGPFLAFSHLASYKTLRVGQDIGILSQMMNEDDHKKMLFDLGFASDATAKRDDEELSFKHASRKVRPLVPSMHSFKQYLGLSTDANLRIRGDVELQFPDGTETVLPMHDDGVHMDIAANDGVLGASFKAEKPGVYVAKVEMRAHTDKGVVFYRSQQHVFRVVDMDLKLDKRSASISIQESSDASEMLKINLHLDSDVDRSLMGRKFRCYAEVWAESSEKSSEPVPVAWIGGMTYVEELKTVNSTSAELVLPLEMSIKWLSRAQAKLPLTLRNVYVQDPDSSIPLSEVDEIKVNVHRIHERNMVVPAPVLRNVIKKYTTTKHQFDATSDEKSESMYFGLRPRENSWRIVREKRKQAHANGVPHSGHRLILVHGYCSSDTPFNTDAFTGFSIFLDVDQNRSNDEFALLLRDFATQFTSISIVSHSQGGLASLHLYSFYWSSMDNHEHLLSGKLISSSDARVMQSVGSPYYGSSLAGGIAAIGDMIGVGCGKNTDLTHDGAELWLTTIPKASRDQMYYYTSQYKKLSWCVLVAQAVLKWPNDGTTEKKYSDLEGGHFVSHLERQCHSDNMKYDGQCRDNSRSKEMNQKAARL